MPLGKGYWYDRKRKVYNLIDEHAHNAVKRCRYYLGVKSTTLNPFADRDAIVLAVCKRGFVRIRHHQNVLGWQFYGNIRQSMAAFRRYCKKHEVGGMTEVTVTDFKSSINFTRFLKDLRI